MLLSNHLVELYKNDTSQLSSILGIFYNIKTDFQIVRKSKNKYLHFENQQCGKIKNLSIDSNKYYYNVEYAKILFLLLKDLYIEAGYTLLPDNNFILYLL
jgi:hypothetical protein